MNTPLAFSFLIHYLFNKFLALIVPGTTLTLKIEIKMKFFSSRNVQTTWRNRKTDMVTDTVEIITVEVQRGLLFNSFLLQTY